MAEVTGDEEHLTTQVCIVLIFGIPASGKTYIARELVVKEMQLFGETCCVVHICMDDFYPKDTRDEATFVDRHCSSSQDFNWKETRRFVKSCIEEFLSGKDSSKYNDTTASIFGSVLPVHQSAVVIVDDNLPLRSMRHEYYQLARKYSCGFFSVCVQCKLEIAQKRNSQRSNTIPYHTLVAMAAQLEIPDSQKHRWENNSMTVDSSCSKEDPRWLYDTCRDIVEHCTRRLQNPETTETKEKSKIDGQRATSESVLYQCDQILRQLVSKEISKQKGTCDIQNLQELAKRANQSRRGVLNELRSGHLLSVDSHGSSSDKETISFQNLQEMLILRFNQLLKKL